jgi:arabinofuranosyltransferase
VKYGFRLGAIAVSAFVFVWLVLVSSSAGQPKIEIQVESATFGMSEMFFAQSENAFSGELTRTQPLAIGTNTLRFPFGIARGTLGDFQRWDPSNQPGQFVVTSVSMHTAFIHTEIPLTDLVPSLDVGNISQLPDSFSFSAESNDSQLLLTASTTSFYVQNMIRAALVAIALTALIMLLVVLALRNRRRRVSTATSLGKSTQLLTLTRVSSVLIVTAVTIAFAWLSDDALITIRTALNAANGYGPVFNIDERVQAFTHPLWFGINLFAGWFTGQWMLMPMLLGVLATGIATAILAWHVSSMSRIVVLTATLVLSNAFVEYTTSGLENGLSYLLLAGLLVASQRLLRSATIGWSISTGLLFGLLLLNRLDLGLVVLPLGLYLAFSLRRRIPALVALIAAPLVMVLTWFVVSFSYYGTFLPTTFAAKTNVDIPQSELIVGGIRYLAVSFLNDPVSLVILIAGFILAVIVGGTLTRLVMSGVAFYLIYVVWIGGDFMAGRFLAVPVFVTVAVLALERTRAYISLLPESEDKESINIPAKRLGAAATLTVLGALLVLGWGRSLVLTPSATLEARWDFNLNGGVSDERGFHLVDKRGLWQYTGTLRPVDRLFDFSQGAFALGPDRDLVQLQASAANWPRGAQTQSVAVRCGRLGEVGILAGPSVHFVDPCGLTDPFLASLSYVGRDFNWRPGHFLREIPNGYLDAVASGDPSLVNDEAQRNQLIEIWERVRPVSE